MTIMKIIILGNYTRSLRLFRGRLIERFVELGHTVIGYAPDDDLETAEALRSMGAEFRRFPFDRTGTNVFNDLAAVLRFWRILSVERADILLCYSIKPVIYGSLAGRVAGIKRCYSMITGLGYVFTGSGVGMRLLSLLVKGLYRMALPLNDTVFFLNKDDLACFEEYGVVSRAKATKVIDGEGISTSEYTVADRRPTRLSVIGGSGVDPSVFRDGSRPLGGDLVFLLIARLLKHKGITEYIEAARAMRSRHPSTRFWIVGPLDSNPAAFSKADLQGWVDEGVVTYHGESRDVRLYLSESSVYVLPSYREGLPRTILEAMAMGLPIITTDAPGCRETVSDGDNGFLVPVRDVRALVHAMEQFVLHPELVVKMGKRSREIAVERFDVNKINDEILRVMRLI